MTNKTLILHYHQQNTALPLRTDTTSQSRGHDDRQGELFWLDTLGKMDGRGFHLKEKSLLHYWKWWIWIQVYRKQNQATTKEDYRHHRTPQNKQRLCGWNGYFFWITTPAVILLLSLGGEYNRILIHFKLSLQVRSLSLRGNEIKARHGNKNYDTFQVHIFISY